MLLFIVSLHRIKETVIFSGGYRSNPADGKNLILSFVEINASFVD